MLFIQKMTEPPTLDMDDTDFDWVLEPSICLKSEVVIYLLRQSGFELSEEELTTTPTLKQENISYLEFLKVVTPLLVKSEVNGSGKTLAGLTFGTFQLAVQALSAVFGTIDGDGNGFITVGGMQEFLTRLDGMKTSKTEAKEAIEIADKDGDGQLDWNEFRNIVIKGHLVGQFDSDCSDVDSEDDTESYV